MAGLHDRSGRDRELARARIAVEQPTTMRLAFEAIDLLRFAAMRAERAVRPADAFKVGARCVLVGRNVFGGHGGCPFLAAILPKARTYVKYIIAEMSL